MCGPKSEDENFHCRRTLAQLVAKRFLVGGGGWWVGDGPHMDLISRGGETAEAPPTCLMGADERRKGRRMKRGTADAHHRRRTHARSPPVITTKFSGWWGGRQGGAEITQSEDGGLQRELFFTALG